MVCYWLPKLKLPIGPTDTELPGKLNKIPKKL